MWSNKGRVVLLTTQEAAGWRAGNGRAAYGALDTSTTLNDWADD